MKLNAWLPIALIPFTALSLLAQTPPPVPLPSDATPAPTTTPTPTPTPTAPEPAAKDHKPKSKAKKKKAAAVAAPEPARTNSTLTLDPPVNATVKCNVLDVRGQGSFNGEIITYLKKGENVTVLAEITLGHAHAHEPAHWSRIVLPANTAVWVAGEFIDPESMEVKAKKVNVRGGPGENYSIVARLDKGTVVKQIGKKEGWMEIAAPGSAVAYVASEYLEKTGPAALAVVPPTASATPTPEPTPAPPPPVVVNVPEPTPAPTPTPPPTPEPTPTPPAGLTAPAPTAASQSEQDSRPVVAPAPSAMPGPVRTEGPRVVTREGFVHRAKNIQAPSGFELHDIKTGVLTEYLQPAPGQKSFKTFVGTRVHLTGSEFFDPDWPRTPVLHVQSIDLMP